MHERKWKMQSSYCYWRDFEVHYRFDDGGLIDWSLYPKLETLLDAIQHHEEEIEEIIHEDIENNFNSHQG
jgi:hypothetical protein